MFRWDFGSFWGPVTFDNGLANHDNNNAAASFYFPMTDSFAQHAGSAGPEAPHQGSVFLSNGANVLHPAHGDLRLGMNGLSGHDLHPVPHGDVLGRSDYSGHGALGNGRADYGIDTAVHTINNTTSIGTSGNFQNQDVNGLLSGVAWNTSSLTYSFPQSASNYGGSYGDPAPSNGFQAMSGAQEDVVRYALNLVSQYTQLTFTEITETDSTHATLRFSCSSYPPTSYAYYPSNDDTGGDAFYGNIRDMDPTKAGYAFDTIMHEIGHALGLKHGQDDDGTHGTLPTSHNSTEWSIMDYHSYIGADSYYNNEEGSGNQTYMVDDISALQYMYGANFNTHAENTTYSWSPTTGEEFINGVGQGASSTNTIYGAIWDGNGTDTYDLSNYTTDVNVNLNPGEWSTFSTDQLAYLDVFDSSVRAPGNIDNANEYNKDARSLIEDAFGGSGNDTLTGNKAVNLLEGNGGNDTLNGYGGADTLEGGSGNDTYIVNNTGVTVVESTNNGTDTIKTSLTSFTLGANVEDLTHTGTSDFKGVGNSEANTIIGGRGNDVLNGAGGNDHLYGSAGNDIYIVTSAGVTVTEGLDRGTDTVQTTLSSYTLSLNVENLTYKGSGHFRGTGNNLANVITGGAGDDTLKGLKGADHLNGLGGDDTFFYNDAADSTGKVHDTVKGFDALHDKFNVPGTIVGINHAINSGSLSTSNFDTNLAAAANSTHLGAHHAVLFTPSAGGLAGDTFLVIDVNGQAGYQAGADLVIQLDHAVNLSHLSISDFI